MTKEYYAAHAQEINSRKRAEYALNPEPIRVRNRKWNTANPKKRRNNALVRMYGITVEQYDKLLAKQGGVCALCGKVPGKRHLSTDHNHSTDVVRGLLCSECNTALERVEIPGWSKKAARYLKEK